MKPQKPDDAVAELLAWLDGDEHALDAWPEPEIGVHGRLLTVRQEAYHDIYVYEDGFEERDYIGD